MTFPKKYLKKLLFYFVVFSFFAVISPLSITPVQAADSGLELNYPEILGNKPETIATGLPEYVKYIYDFAIAFAGLIALGSLIWGGFIYFSSSGDPTKIKSAKEQMTAAFTGLLILLSSYLILATINPNLVNLLPLSPLPIPEPPASVAPTTPNKITKASEISLEEPLGSIVKATIGEEATKKIELTTEETDEFLKEGMNINDSDLSSNGLGGFFGLGKFLKTFADLTGGSNSTGGKTFDRISDLMKYLKTLTDGCFCENIRAFCSKPSAGAQPIGCSGDPCQIDQQDSGIESDSPRAKMENVLKITQEKIKGLLDIQKKINSQKLILSNNLRNFQEVEEGISACQEQGADISPLSEYLETKQLSIEAGDKIVEIPNSKASSHGDPLTFYCAKGGNILDSSCFYKSYGETGELEARLEQSEQYEPTQGTSEAERLACPIKITVGGTLDKLRETAVVDIIKFERASDLIGQMVKQIQEMVELVSQCNNKECKASCSCVPNPCFGCCAPTCAVCVPFCLKPCLQTVGTCQGEVCPREEITAKSEEIKKTEDKIFETIDQIKKTFPQISALLSGTQNPDNLANVSSAVGLCYSPNANDMETNSWTLMSCASAKGNYNSTGQLIKDCNPRDFYCCAMTSQDIADMSLPLPTDESPVYIIPSEKFQPLPAVNGCPKGWLCVDDIKKYNQYNDASEPLKQLLSCARTKLDAVQKIKGLKTTDVLGRISFITDPNLYGNNNTCDWTSGPLTPGGCSHTYGTKYGLERISSHYGGTLCRYDHLSYAVDLDFSDDLQKQYAEEIIKSIKECDPGAHIIDEVSRVHIGISESSDCQASDY
jgi:hypothetical protein